jgi:N-acetylated-alpha-linked acidic dipeptidase
VRDRFTAAGLDEVTTTTHDVLLPWPEEISVEMVAPRAWRASMQETSDAGEIHPADALSLPYHAYSASGEVTARVVYAGMGTPEDYTRLEAMGIDVHGAIVLVRYAVPYSYRGFDVLTAQQRGAAGILIYSDPADDGSAKGAVYPRGPWGPDTRIQRGSVVYDFLVPGDPLTPGWPSTADAPRVTRDQAISLPRIMSAPLSATDARVLLEAIGGPEAPAAWRGALPITYRVGGGPLVVRLRVRSDDRVRPVWTVTGLIRGTERPDQVVIVGNHRDAWTYGGSDPSSGTAAMLELIHAFGDLRRAGWRPKRSILFASWDAEEFSLISSTEWAEEHAAMLQAQAVAYLNVDSGVSGRVLNASAVPALNRAVTEVTQLVKDPGAHIPVAAAFRDAAAAGVLPDDATHDLVGNRFGGGSDYGVFLNFLGVPVADFSFRGPYGVYHSAFDNHDWVERLADPGFRYHVTLAQLWGVLTMRLADADVLPIDYQPYAGRLHEFIDEVRSGWPEPSDFDDATAAANMLGDAAARLEAARQTALSSTDRAAQTQLDRRLMRAERALLDPDGLPGRPWYRHTIFAPQYSYAPEVLPAVVEAVRTGDPGRVRFALDRLTQAIQRAARALDGGAG